MPSTLKVGDRVKGVKATLPRFSSATGVITEIGTNGWTRVLLDDRSYSLPFPLGWFVQETSDKLIQRRREDIRSKNDQQIQRR